MLIRGTIVVTMLCSTVLFLLMISPVSAIEKSCTFCHTDHKGKGGALLKKDINELCSVCHQKRIAKGEHKVGIKISKPVKSIPLQDGKMTCISCHDPHSKTAAMLRMPASDLCVLCHEK